MHMFLLPIESASKLIKINLRMSITRLSVRFAILLDFFKILDLKATNSTFIDIMKYQFHATLRRRKKGIFDHEGYSHKWTRKDTF